MKLKYYSKKISLNYNKDKCIGCGFCVEVCPREVFNIFESKAVIENKDLCIECGACAKNCPAKAISVDAGVACAYAMLTSKNGECSCGDGGCC